MPLRTLIAIVGLVGLAAPAPAGLVPVAIFGTADPVDDLAIDGATAYLAAAESGLLVLDLGDPAAPGVLDHYETGDIARGVAVVGDRVYLATGGRLLILDAANPSALSLLGELVVGVAFKVTVAGDRAYVSCGGWGLRIIDVSDPTQPAELGRFRIPGDLITIHAAVAGDRAYVTHADIGGYPVAIVDVSDPAAPEALGWFTTVSSEGTVVRDGLAFTADEDFVITDVSEPENPVRVGAVPGLHGRTLVLADDRAYLTCYFQGLAVVDVSDPTAPRTAGGFASGSAARAVAVGGDLVLLSNADHGVWILVDDPAVAAADATPPPGSPRLTAYPNPFNPRTELVLALDPGGRTRLQIHDLRGRRVRTLIDADLPAGRHTATWDGTDGAGRPVPTGVYVAVATTSAGRTAARLALLR